MGGFLFESKEFGIYRPVVITGELRRDVLSGVFSGSIYKTGSTASGDVYRYVMAGLTVKSLAKIGITSINQLSLLHSMNRSNKLDIVVFHNQPSVLCFRMTDFMKTQLENQEQLRPLCDLRWGLFEIVNYEIDQPFVGNFNYLNRHFAYRELDAVFRKINKEGVNWLG